MSASVQGGSLGSGAGNSDHSMSPINNDMSGGSARGNLTSGGVKSSVDSNGHQNSGRSVASGGTTQAGYEDNGCCTNLNTGDGNKGSARGSDT